jgi:ATP-binding cassette subfamily C (CFTR/MRP) protein 1
LGQALARAVFSRCGIIILDDVFSALDAKTEATIVDGLISKNGLLRTLGSTVLLTTHSVHHLPMADSIIVLGSDGQVLEQGSYSHLKSQNGFVSQILVHPEILQRSPKGSMNVVEPDNEKGNSPVVMPKAFQGPSANDVSDLTRRTGDTAVYKYYFGSIGWKLCLASGVSTFLYMVGSNFPSKRFEKALTCKSS